MSQAVLRMKVDRSTLADVANKLAALGPEVEVKGFRTAGRKAAKTLRTGIEQRTPRGVKPPKYQGKPHLKDNVNVKQKTYKAKDGATVFFAIGFMAGSTLPHGHLVEEGTQARYTQHKTQYQKLAVKTIKVRGRKVVKYRKKSIGSKLKDGANPSLVRYRGIMPAFRPVSKTLTSHGPIVERVIESELKKVLAKYQ